MASHANPAFDLDPLCRSTFEGVLGQPGLNPTENCMVLEQDSQIKGLALIFREFPIRRSIIEVMTSPEITGTPEEMELISRAVARAKSAKLNVAHVCVPHDSGKEKS